MSRSQVSWIMYIVGSLLVFGSWVNIVPTGIAWIGWVVALAGWGIGAADRPKQAPPPALSKADEISKLELLRSEGVLTDDEFQAEKARLLRQ